MDDRVCTLKNELLISKRNEHLISLTIYYTFKRASQENKPELYVLVLCGTLTINYYSMLNFRATSHSELKAIQVGDCYTRLIYKSLPLFLQLPTFT